MASLPQSLAGHFGGSAFEYKVSLFSAHFLAVFFPSWVSRESAIGHSPLCLDGMTVRFSN